jgi:LAO/AO transport system kinase
MGKTHVDSILSGNLPLMARLLTQVENGTAEGLAVLNELFPYTGKAHLIGVTGAPGTGKSSLVNQIALHYRKSTQPNPKRVAIIAVDPTSPFTGGAVLGDRVRMRDLSGDPGVFIRSMASRGSLGGLAQATASMVQVFDAAGFEVILVETVGAGQTEVDIARLAHTTLVVESPGLGDEIQAIKAGILEIADILVLNKADMPGVDNTERALKGMLGLAHPVEKIFHHGETMVTEGGIPAASSGWVPPILRTIATDGTGVAELVVAIEQHAQHLHQADEWRSREKVRLEVELEALLTETLAARFRQKLPEGFFDNLVGRLVKRTLSPREAVKLLLDESENPM